MRRFALSLLAIALGLIARRLLRPSRLPPLPCAGIRWPGAMGPPTQRPRATSAAGRLRRLHPCRCQGHGEPGGAGRGDRHVHGRPNEHGGGHHPGPPSTDTRVVTLSLGGNDLLNLLNDPTDACVINPASVECQVGLAQALGGVAANYPTIMGTLDFALDQDPGTEKVFVLTLYNPFGGTGSPFEAPIDQGPGPGPHRRLRAAQIQPMNAGLNDIVSCTSAFFGATVMDGQAVGDNALALTHIGDAGFNIHPNDDGYEAIAKLIDARTARAKIRPAARTPPADPRRGHPDQLVAGALADYPGIGARPELSPSKLVGPGS